MKLAPIYLIVTMWGFGVPRWIIGFYALWWVLELVYVDYKSKGKAVL